MGLSEYVPVAVAGCCAAAVVYVALSQAYPAEAGDAAADDPPPHQHAPSKAGSKATAPRAPAASPPPSEGTAVQGPPTPDAVPTANGSGSDAGSSSASGNSKTTSSLCDHCRKAPAQKDHLLRCSRCHHAWYCTKACQRAAWPQHKRTCHSSSNGAGSPTGHTGNGTHAPASGSGSSSPTGEAAVAGSSNAGGSNANGASSSSSDGGGDEAGVSVMDALRHVLQSHAGGGGGGASDDPLQQQFERAVLLFVQGEHAAGAAALAAVQAAAEGAGRVGLAGDACKWRGHAHLRLGDLGRAAGAFAAGCELADKSGSKRLQVDCLSGLGTMYRDAGQLPAAAGFLRQALTSADSVGEGEGRAALRASVLTLLGTVLVGGDGEEQAAAVGHLEEAVGLREDQVVSLHEAGQRGSALASAIMEHAGSLVSLAGAYYVRKRYEDAAEAYGKSLAIFDMVEDVDKQIKCLINLANLFELQLKHPDSRQAAAQQRSRLYRLAAAHMGRDAPGTCVICCDAITPLRPTRGGSSSGSGGSNSGGGSGSNGGSSSNEAAVQLEAGQGEQEPDGRLLVLGCAHCFHYKCWDEWSEQQSATCPSCKLPSHQVEHPQQKHRQPQQQQQQQGQQGTA